MEKVIKERILILDGAMGTMIGDVMGRTGNSDELNLSRPDIIADIHCRYLQAGADIITTNTFSAQRISQADYHMEHEARRMALAGAQIARRCADKFSSSDKPRFVAGSIGPTNKTCSMSPDVSNPALRELTYDQLFEAYAEQVEALLEGGVDALLIETIFDTLNAKVAIDASLTIMQRRGRQVPIMLSVTVSDLAGRTLSGQTLDAFLASISSYPIFSVGLNCSFGADQMLPFLRQLARKAPYYISAYPNAGLPNAMGLYDETAESMAPKMGEMVSEGLVNIIGGCCGTTPDFIARYVPLVEGKAPHVPAQKPQTLWLSGLEMLDVTPDVRFVNVGERCNVAGSRKFLRLIKEKQYDEALSIARKQVADGALVIDVNMDDGMLDARQEMVNFLNMMAAEPDIASVPAMIDSSDWNVIVSGLKCVQGKCIVNSISLKEGEEVFIRHAQDVKRYGAAVVVMCFDEQGQATSYERRTEIAERSYRILTQQVGISPLDIIFDPNVLAVATGMEEHDAYAADFIRATRWIRENLPGAHVSGGVSNLSFSFRGNNYIREAMHAVFLYHAIQAGMDFGIVNPATKVLYTDLPADQLEIIEDVILNRKAGTSDRLIALAQMLAAANAEPSGSTASAGNPSQSRESGTSSVEDRLQQALIKGVGDYLQVDLEEALQKYPRAVSIIEGPLMAGMNRVGELFGQGKMFLPQVVKTARTMKQAVSILQPYIEKEREAGSRKAGKILLATVKGDVHDIGKNIVSVIMACNNYEVIDMGVMVPAEQIVRKAVEEQVDMIGLSGLITPSLEEMVNVAHEMQRAGLDIPIMIGGATTSELHVALKIAPVYGGPVVWMKDASQNALVAARLMNRDEERKMEQELDSKYEYLREHYEQEQQQLMSLEEARKNKPNLFNVLPFYLFTLLLFSLFTFLPLSAQQKREFRGAWIQCVNGQFKGVGTEAMQRTLTYQLDELQKDGCNAIIFQVRPECDALYESQLEPWSYYLTGEQGQAPYPYWDPLQWMIDQCHRRGMELHAWINPYRAKTKSPHSNASNHVVVRHPEWTFRYDGLTLLNPALEECRNYICDVVRDLVERYDVDGLHIDDYFYPYPVAGVEIPDDTEYRFFGKRFADRGDWRRHNVDLFIEQLSKTIHKAKPWVKFGVSPFGIFRNQKSDPEGSRTNGLQNYDQLYANVLLWDERGWMDYCVPQIYWEIGNKAADYDELIHWWNDHLTRSHLYIGEDVERTAKFSQMGQKMALHQQLSRIQGTVLWYAKAAVDNVGNYGTQLRNTYWCRPALMPLMPTIDRKAPKKPRKVKAIDMEGHHVLFWTAPKGNGWKNEAVKYVVYCFEQGEAINTDDATKMLAVTTECHYELPSAPRGSRYVYAVTALDRMQNESSAVKVKVKY